MKEKYKVCCVTGHRPKNFPWDYSDKECPSHQEYTETMVCYIDYLISKYDFNYFICGGALGVDMDFAESVIELRDHSYENIKLEIAIPCKNQDLKWSRKDKERYQKILNNANEITILSEQYTRCMQDRNKYMVDKSDIVLAFWNFDITSGATVNTIKYAQSKKKNIEYFPLRDFVLNDVELDANLHCTITDLNKTICFYLLTYPNIKTQTFMQIDLDELDMSNTCRLCVTKHPFELNAMTNLWHIKNNTLFITKNFFPKLSEFLNKQFTYIIAPPKYEITSHHDFISRYITLDSYSDKIKKLFCFFIDKITHIEPCETNLEKYEDYLIFISYICNEKTTLKKIINELIYNKLKPADNITSYFNEDSKIKYFISWLNKEKLFSIFEITNDKIIVSPKYKSDHSMLIPYIAALLDCGNADISTRVKFIYSVLNQDNVSCVYQ